MLTRAMVSQNSSLLGRNFRTVSLPSAPRRPYIHVTVPVDKHINRRQTLERLEIDLSIDENLIVNIEVTSTLRNETRVCVVDLEFGLSLVQEVKQPLDKSSRVDLRSRNFEEASQEGSIRIRSNVAKCNSRVLWPKRSHGKYRTR